jgi:outer membrane murein-binding lipoprotein Lpp
MKKVMLLTAAVVFTSVALFGCSDSGTKQEKQSKETASRKVQQSASAQDVAQKNLTQFEDLLKAARCYIQKGLDVKELYPLTAENAGCLDKSYGGYEKPAPNYNWTTQGGWLGIWGNENQIGVGVTGSFEEVKPVIEKYKANAKEIFFPYPTKYDANQKIEPNTRGELLMVFDKGFVVGAGK